MGISNTAGTLAGVVGTSLTGALLQGLGSGPDGAGWAAAAGAAAKAGGTGFEVHAGDGLGADQGAGQALGVLSDILGRVPAQIVDHPGAEAGAVLRDP